MDTLKQHQLIKSKIQELRALLKKDIVPYLQELDKEGRIAPGFFKRLSQKELIDPFMLNDESESQKTSVLFINLLEEMGKVNAGLALCYLGQSLGLLLAEKYQNHEWISILYKKILSGEIKVGLCLQTVQIVGEELILEHVLNGPVGTQYWFFIEKPEEHTLSLAVNKDNPILCARDKKRTTGCNIASFADLHFQIKDVVMMQSESDLSSILFQTLKAIFRAGVASVINAMQLQLIRILGRLNKQDHHIHHLIVDFYSRYRLIKAILHETAYRYDRGQKIEKESNVARLQALELLHHSFRDTETVAYKLNQEEMETLHKLWLDLSFFLRGDDYSFKPDLQKETLNLIQSRLFS